MVRSRLILDAENIGDEKSSISIPLLLIRMRFIYESWLMLDERLPRLLDEFEYIFIPYISHYIGRIDDQIIEKMFENHIIATLSPIVEKSNYQYQEIFNKARDLKLKE